MKYFLDTYAEGASLIDELKEGDILFCSEMVSLAQNTKELKLKIEKILSSGGSVYFRLENIQFSNKNTAEQKNLKHFLDVFCSFDAKNLSIRRRFGIEKAKILGKYSQERRKKIPLDLREQLLKEREMGISVQKIIKKYNISRKTFYNYTQYSTKSILKNIGDLLSEKLIKK